MRIGIDATFLESQRGGVARILTNLLKLWPQMTTRHQFVLYFEQSVPPDDFLRQRAIEHRVIPRPALFRGSSLPREQVLLPLQIRRDEIDLFFAPWYYLPLYCPAPKTVVAAWDISFSTHRDHYHFKEGLRLHLFCRRSCRHASGTFTCSAFDKRQIERYYGVPSDRVCALPLAPDPKFKRSTEPVRLAALRRKYNLPDKYLLSMGVIFNRRHVDVIIDGFNAVRAEYPDVGLLVVGQNRTVPAVDVEGRMRALAGAGRGTYLAWAPEDEVVDLYNGAWYYICLSTVDGEATMLKEAMRCGTPVVTSPLLQETVGGHAVIVRDPTSRDDMARTFRRVISDTGLREQLAVDGLEWSRSLSWERVAEMSLAFLESR
jgi:alpha-1,3-rhamnosyl/mannosyltransferase